MSEENRALLRRLVEEGLNKHNLALLDELYADCVHYSHYPGTRIMIGTENGGRSVVGSSS